MLGTIFPWAISRNIPCSFIISIGANIGCGLFDEKYYLANSNNIILHCSILDFAENLFLFHVLHVQLLNSNMKMSNF